MAADEFREGSAIGLLVVSVGFWVLDYSSSLQISLGCALSNLALLVASNLKGAFTEVFQMIGTSHSSANVVFSLLMALCATPVIFT